ncbi:MAG: methyltransferase domain-containing protein [Thermodesulfobacteriota bacterium]|nr:methyltransferase domain-containing protein [Thermodesulfobacteriota bacterium]
MSDYYQKNYQEYFRKTVTADPTSFLESFAAKLSPGAKVIDIGCGSGRDLLWLKKRGFKPVGFERSKGLADLAEQYSGARVIRADFELFEFSGMDADGILLTGALVHLKKEKFQPLLRSIVKGVKPKGIISISLKQGKGSLIDSMGRSFYLWQESELRNLFKDSSLSVLSITKNSSALKTGETWLTSIVRCL